MAGTEGRWLQGDAAVVTGGRLGRLGLRAMASGFGLRYLDPFTYDAEGIELRPSASLPTGRFILSVRPRLTMGRWETDALEGDLQVLGGEIAVDGAFGALTTSAAAGAARVENGVTAGTYVSADAAAMLDRGRWTLGAELRVQRTPLETELGGGVRGSLVAAPGVELSAYTGRRVRDPLFGTAGSVGFSLGATVRAVRLAAAPPPAVASLGEAADGGRAVHFALRAPEAETVELVGDFTGWEAVPMEARGDGWWRASQVLPSGLHHFGFVVDGHWVIPPEAPGVVEDGWGRRNASIVVEP